MDLAARYRQQREELLGRSGIPGPAERSALSQLTDRFLHELFAVVCPPGMALVAVGGYGRGELGPGSDLDLVLLVQPGAQDVAAVADRLWYPIWDAAVAVDHAVRTPEQARRVASEDLRAALGLLDLRLIAGDAGMAEEVRSRIAADWRSAARSRVPLLLAEASDRRERHGDVRYALEPDIKSGGGGLRDVSVLRAVRASWLAAAGLDEVLTAEVLLRDVRDAQHRTSGRGRGVLVAEEQAAVAGILGRADRDTLLREVHRAARVVSFALDAASHTVGRAGRRPAGRWRRSGTAERIGLAAGVVADDGEVVLARDVRPEVDAVLPLRTAAAAAQAGLPLAPATAQRLLESPTLPTPWPAPARDAFLSLLGAGAGLVPVWEALDHVGLVQRLLPEWADIADLPQRSPVHRFTVDRHSVEAAVQASALTREVERPDLLLVGALVHDLGKAIGGVDHCADGVPVARAIAERIGFGAADVDTVVRLVADHLLLPETATRRDLADPATVASVAARVSDPDYLALLHALVRADARATGPAASSGWRMALIDDLVRRTGAVIAGRTSRLPRLPELPAAIGDEPQVESSPSPHGHLVRIVAPDRPGLLAAGAGVLSLHRLAVRSARIAAGGGVAVQEWLVTPEFGDPPSAERLRADLRRALGHTLGLAAKLAEREQAYRSGSAAPPPTVAVIEGASESATVLEVRAHDRIGLLHDAAAELTAAGVDVQAAVVSTLGSDAIDVFYVRRSGRALTRADAAGVAHRLASALTDGDRR